jgi:penicillin-binding protein 1B
MPPRTQLKKLRKQIATALALVVGVGLLALLAWVFYLDKQITRQFEGRRWTLPAQVYAEPTELYVGQSFSATALEEELQRLGYHKTDAASSPGSYLRRGSHLEFMSRRFQFTDATQEPTKIFVDATAKGITTLKDASREDVAIFRLDPLVIGSIFPIHGEDRVIVKPDEVPKLLPAALKVAEDRKFDAHHGVNFLAIVRAAFVNLRAGQIQQGGSTLTQQLVKSYFLDNRRTFGRKIEEAVMAMLLEVHFEKADLMNAYINEIYLGQDGERAIHGFGLASQFYFGKPLAELQPHEIATLVAIVRGPSYYDPRRHPDRTLARRDLVLKLMAEFKVIEDGAAKRAMSRPLGIVNASQSGGYYPAFLDLVRRTLRRDYREEDLTEAGLKIFTTLNPSVQSHAETILDQELKRLEQARKQKKPTPLQGVVVVTAPQNGEVIAMVGGRDAGYAGFNRALDAKRSMGSLVKPVIYLAAMESGRFNPASIVEDAPIEVKLANGKIWKPQNISQEVYGPVPLVRALAQSLNLATVHLGMDVGLDKVAHEFKALGIEAEPPQLPAILLGAIDLSPLQVAQLYNGLANGGFNTQLRAVRAVLDEEGKPLKSFALEVAPVASPAAVYEVNRMMVEVIDRGSGRGARAVLAPDLVVAGKSGTSSDYRDSWFAGFSGENLAVVWIGYDDNSPTGLTGSTGALAVWSRLMAALPTSSWSMPMPEGLTEVTVDFMSGMQAKPECSAQLITIPIPIGTELPVQPGCETSLLGRIGERAREWWQGLKN